MTTASEIKKLHTNLEAAEFVYENAYAAYAQDEGNEDLGILFDRAESDLVEAEQSFIKALVDFTGGMLDRRDVRRMLVFKRTELDSLVHRLAA